MKVICNQDNAIDLVIDCGTVLDFLDIPEVARRMRVPIWFRKYLESSFHMDTNLLPKSFGRIDRFQLIEDEDLNDMVVFKSCDSDFEFACFVSEGTTVRCPDFDEWNW